MFRFVLCVSLILVHVFGQSTDDEFLFSTDLFVTESSSGDVTNDYNWQTDMNSDSSQSWDSTTTEETSTEQLLEFSTGAESNQTWHDLTTEEPWGFNSTDGSFETTTEEASGFNSTDGSFETTTEETSGFNSTDGSFETTTEEASGFNSTDGSFETTAEEPWGFNSTDGLFETTTEVTQLSTESYTTQTWENSTGGETTEQVTDIVTTMTSTICPSVITPEMLEEMRKEIIDTILRNITDQFNSKIEELEARLAESNCSQGGITPAIQLSWQIYENLQIPLTGWQRVFDEPYSHPTRFEDLNQISGICHHEVLVGAKHDGLIKLAAVGPVSVLMLNTPWNQAKQFGQVYWYSSSGRSFGFAPTGTIRQTSGDNQDLDDPQRLSWILDQSTGGYRAGIARSLSTDSQWRKVIYCN